MHHSFPLNPLSAWHVFSQIQVLPAHQAASTSHFKGCLTIFCLYQNVIVDFFFFKILPTSPCHFPHSLVFPTWLNISCNIPRTSQLGISELFPFNHPSHASNYTHIVNILPIILLNYFSTCTPYLFCILSGILFIFCDIFKSLIKNECTFIWPFLQSTWHITMYK